MTTTKPELTVYYDGSCPLCRAEIGCYRRQEGSAAIDFVDVSQDSADVGTGLERAQAMARFHVRGPGGGLISGAAGFVEVWERLPGWRWLARLARLRGVLFVLEIGYVVFLPVRPLLSRLFGLMFARKSPPSDLG